MLHVRPDIVPIPGQLVFRQIDLVRDVLVCHGIVSFHASVPGKQKRPLFHKNPFQMVLWDKSLKTSAVPPKLARNSPARRRAITRLSLVTGEKPVGTYWPCGVQSALGSPLGKVVSAAIPPPAALWEKLDLLTRLRHRFVALNLCVVYTVFFGFVKSKFEFFLFA